MKTIIALLLLLFTANVDADEDITERELFELFNGCAKMWVDLHLYVQGTHMVLLERQIRSDIEDRLHTAGIYDRYAAPSTFAIGISVAGYSYSITIYYMKTVNDVASGISDSAVMWRSGWHGTHANNPELILNKISDLVDKFIAEYLRINKDACEGT